MHSHTHHSITSMRSHSTFLFLVPFLYLLFLSANNAHSQILCIEKEKRALLDFKLSFVADPLSTLSSWSIDNDDCCHWEGVRCDAPTRHVTLLNLGGGLKSYKLRPSLLELQALTSLDFSENQFTMRIPKFIGCLSNLTYLNLGESGFFGKIPPHLGNLSKLHSLIFGPSNNLYADNLHWVSHLSSIKHLNFDDVKLSSAVDWASSLKTLPNLSFFECRSCSLPPPILSSISHINSSTSLQRLDLSNSSVSSSTFSYLINGSSNLLNIFLDYMTHEHYILHEFLGALMIGKSKYSLESLSLVGNSLIKLPSEVLMFPSLTSLDVSINRMSISLPKILQYLPPNLTSLDLSSNFLTGVVSDSHFHKFLKLQNLKLSYNNLLAFNFSEGWMPPFQLHTLHLSSCRVGPRFPNWTLTQTKLVDLDISNSMISGSVPDAFWHFSSRLSYLNLSHNNLHCMIPNLLLSFVDPPEIDLSYNTFHGAIPLFLFNAFTLDLSNNRFKSFPPLQPRMLTSEIEIINLSGNRLSGSLPNWLYQFRYLVTLNLANNKLSGTLPEEIGSIYLYMLHLSNNNFSGPLPLSMKNCTDLTILELANNKLSGVVPLWLGESMPRLIALTLRSNNFVGELPSTLCHLQRLQILDLSDNQISGCIPGCVYNFTAMSIDGRSSLVSSFYGVSIFLERGYFIYLDYTSIAWKGAVREFYSRNLDQCNVINLSGNLLRGEIPTEVTSLKQLRSLNLSRNALNGSIPDKIGQLANLEALLLSSNRLRGEIPQSLAGLTFLDTLNLSNNNLSGRIPTSTQLQSFGASSYDGNLELCGDPLPTKCLGVEDGDRRQPLSSKNARDEDDESFDIQVFLASSGMGFAFGFLGVLGILHFNRPWRLAFFQLSGNIADRVFVATSLFQSRIRKPLFQRQMELQICD